MPKTRRAFILLGVLLVIAGLHSVSVREWGRCAAGIEGQGIAAGGQTGRGHWEFYIGAANRANAQPPRHVDLILLRVSTQCGPAWWLYAFGGWFSVAAILLVPAMMFEIRSRLMKRMSSGFPVDQKRTPPTRTG
jgi:hypothetical protein